MAPAPDLSPNNPAPTVGTTTAVLQYPWSQNKLVCGEKRVAALQDDQKMQSELPGAQHWAYDPEVE
ncbi:unnamed protein product [Alternaria alternata]